MPAPVGGPAVRIRRASPADADACVALLLGAYGGDGAAWRQGLTASLAAGELVLVAVVGDAVVGYGRAGPRVPPDAEDPAPAGWYLAGLVVDPDHRGRGVARRLVGDLVAHRPAGDVVWSVADASNAASLALHRSAGFSEVLRSPRLLGEPFGAGGVLLRLGP